jgi:hypothetical protein
MRPMPVARALTGVSIPLAHTQGGDFQPDSGFDELGGLAELPAKLGVGVYSPIRRDVLLWIELFNGAQIA